MREPQLQKCGRGMSREVIALKTKVKVEGDMKVDLM
jgi:hypothetical protein